MELIKKIAVALDGSKMDDVLIRAVSRLKREMHIDKVYFIHIAPKLTYPQEILENNPNVLAPLDEVIKRDIELKINEFLGENFEIPYDIIIEEGNVIHGLLHELKIKDADLIVMGRKKHMKGSGSAARKVARLARCSSLYLPERLPKDDGPIIVPVNFKTACKLALEQAIELVKTGTGSEVICLHVFEVPFGYSSVGLEYDEMMAKMKSNAEKHFKVFMKDIDVNGVKVTSKIIHKHKDESLQDYVNEYAIENDATSIVMGSKSRTKVSAFLFGTNADKVLDGDIPLPTFIVKDKHRQIDLIDAIGEL